MSEREAYKKLYDSKLHEYVLTNEKLEKLKKQLSVLENWLIVTELEEQAKALMPPNKNP